MNSRITGGPTTRLFTARVLGTHDVTYFRCNRTGFIQTEEPYWLEQAYADAISDLDVGCVSRNIRLAEQTARLIQRNFPRAGQLLDYGAGYGLFVRLMRDLGFNCQWYDPFCKNLFARGFEADITARSKFDVVTAFEVFEHSIDPVGDVRRMLEFAPTIVFSTLLVPPGELRGPEDWWYFIPVTGQHVAFHTRESLTELGRQFGASFHTDGVGFHILTREKIRGNPFSWWGKLTARKLLCKITDRLFPLSNQPSLQESDFQNTKLRLEKMLRSEAGDSTADGKHAG